MYVSEKVKRQRGVCYDPLRNPRGDGRHPVLHRDPGRRVLQAGSVHAAGDSGGLCDGSPAGRGGGRHQESGAHARQEHGLRGRNGGYHHVQLFHHPGQPDLPPPQGQKERGALDGGRHGADDDCGRAGQLLHPDSGVSDADEPAARGDRRHGHEGLELYRQHGEAGDFHYRAVQHPQGRCAQRGDVSALQARVAAAAPEERQISEV